MSCDVAGQCSTSRGPLGYDLQRLASATAAPDGSRVHRLFAALAIVLAVAGLAQRTSAQSLTYSIFERYLEALREQAGIPGMSALVLQNKIETWSRGFGRADVEAAIDARADTPYVLGGLSQTFGATLLLKECIDENVGDVNDLVTEWDPEFAEPATRIGDLLAHVSPTTHAFSYDLARFSMLTGVIEACAGVPYARLLAEQVMTGLGFVDSAPGTMLVTPTAEDVSRFEADDLARYQSVLGRLARPYRVEGRVQIRTELIPTGVNAATGVVASASDLARFYRDMDPLGDGLLLRGDTLDQAWRRQANLPVGYGWFVQPYNDERVVWQFGEVKNAYSSLVVSVPDRDLTFILLANSDALALPFGRETGDVTASIFARLFLRIFVP